MYDGLHGVIGRRRISRFLNDLARSHVVGKEIRKIRPAVVLSNDTANALLNQVQVVPISSQVGRLYPAEATISLNSDR